MVNRDMGWKCLPWPESNPPLLTEVFKVIVCQHTRQTLDRYHFIIRVKSSHKHLAYICRKSSLYPLTFWLDEEVEEENQEENEELVEEEVEEDEEEVF